jgi:hypothetical protein
MEMQKLNNLVISYQTSGDEATFNEIYAEVITKGARAFETIGKSIRADKHETFALYEDTLLRCIGKYDGSTDFIKFYRSSVARARTDVYRKKKKLSERETAWKYQEGEEEGSAYLFEIADDFNLEETATQTKEADQRQLIDFLTKDSDATTKAIVEAYRTQTKSSALAIAKDLGMHHYTITRKLEKLAGKFDSKQFGNHQDYLVAL